MAETKLIWMKLASQLIVKNVQFEIKVKIYDRFNDRYNSHRK